MRGIGCIAVLVVLGDFMERDIIEVISPEGQRPAKKNLKNKGHTIGYFNGFGVIIDQGSVYIKSTGC
jgi:hypothetical protein